MTCRKAGAVLLQRLYSIMHQLILNVKGTSIKSRERAARVCMSAACQHISHCCLSGEAGAVMLPATGKHMTHQPQVKEKHWTMLLLLHEHDQHHVRCSCGTGQRSRCRAVVAALQCHTALYHSGITIQARRSELLGVMYCPAVSMSRCDVSAS